MAAGAVSRFPAILRSRKLYSKLGTLLAVRVAAIGVAKRLDVSHPETLRNIRFAFVAINLLAILVFIYVISRIRAKNDQTKIRTKPSRALAKIKAAILRTVTGKERKDPKADELVDTTIHDHDLAQAKAQIKGIIRSVIIMGAVSIYFGWNKMLIAPAISRPVDTIRHALFKLHVLDAEAVGDLRREATEEQVAAAEKAKAAAEKTNGVNGNGKVEEKVEEEVENEKVIDEKEVVPLAPEVDEYDIISSGESSEEPKLRQRRVAEAAEAALAE